MLRDQDGNQLYRRVEVHVLYPEDVLKAEKIQQKAPAGKGISEEGVTELLMKVADRLETLYPWWRFEAVEIKTPQPRTVRYNFVFRGYAQIDLQNPQKSSATSTEAADATPTTETVGNTESLIPAATELGVA